MINGEGTEVKPISAITSPSDPPGDRDSDGGDDLSHYSSCGGESEFERYCSASSAMGTPSFRGSSFQDSDFGSLKSFKLGGENTDFKNIGAERVLSGYRESECGSGSGGGNEFCCDEKDNGTLNLNGRMDGFAVSDVDLRGNFYVDGDWGNEIVIENEKKGNSEVSSRIPGDFLKIGEGKGSYVEKGSYNGERLEIDGREDRNLSDEGEASSRCEHSEGEDSMFGCGSDDDRKIDLYYGKNVLFRGGESGIKENQLVMNSAVAFGSNDWDDFVQESSENAIGSMVWDDIQAERQTVAQSGTGSSGFTAGNSVTYPNIVLDVRQDNVKNTPAACNQVEAGGKLPVTNANSLSTVSTNLLKLDARSEDAKGVLASSNQVSDIDELDEYLGSSSVHNIFQTEKDPLNKPAPTNEELKIGETESELKNEDMTTSEVMSIHHDIVFEKRNLEERNIELDPLSDSVANHNEPVPVKGKENKETKLFEDNNSFVLPLLADTNTGATTKNNFSSSFDQIEDHFVPIKVYFLLRICHSLNDKKTFLFLFLVIVV